MLLLAKLTMLIRGAYRDRRGGGGGTTVGSLLQPDQP
jgi:hypothetical protein